jgi:hypothetical protein
MGGARRSRWAIGLVVLALLAAGGWIAARMIASPDIPAVFSGP